MGSYIANMDLRIGGRLFRRMEPLTAKVRKNDLAFLLAHKMILDAAEEEQSGTGGKKPKKDSKSGN